jgi:hypothetical protein
MKKMVAALLVAGLTAGMVFAQQDQPGRLSWGAKFQTEMDLNFAEDPPGEDVPGAQLKNYATSAQINLWYGKGLVSMWALADFQVSDLYTSWASDSWSTTFNLSYDNDKSGTFGGKVETGTTGGAELNKVSLYGWLQLLNKRILVQFAPDLKQDSTEYLAKNVNQSNETAYSWDGGRDFMIYGADLWDSPWKTPANLLFEDNSNYGDNQRSFINVNFKNWVRGLQFGFGLPHTGFSDKNFLWYLNTRNDDTPTNRADDEFWDAEDFLLNSNFGVRYDSGPLSFAGGFKLDPDKYQGFYAGGQYKILNDALAIRADARVLNIGGFEDKIGDVWAAEGIEYYAGRLGLNLTVKELYLLRESWWSDQPDARSWDWNNSRYNSPSGKRYGEGSRTEIQVSSWLKYTLVTNKVLAKLELTFYKGLGDLNKNYSEFRISPKIFWATGNQNVSDSLGDFTGLYAQYDFRLGTYWDKSDIETSRMSFGFRWAI